MKVTLNVFSGRENPSWHLSEKDAKSLLERLDKKTVLAATDYQSQLGYSGFTIEANTDERLPDGITPSFFLDGKLAASAYENANIIWSDKNHVEQACFKMARKKGFGKILDTFGLQ